MDIFSAVVFYNMFDFNQIVYILDNSGKIVTSQDMHFDEIVDFLHQKQINRLELIGSSQVVYQLKEQLETSNMVNYNNNDLKIEVTVA